MPRKSLIDSSGHREEIEHLLIDAQWSSATVAKYIELKYGNVIPSSSLRFWRVKRVKQLKAEGKLPEHWETPTGTTVKDEVAKILFPKDTLPDVLARRLTLVQLQERRIKVDAEHELGMNKLFASLSKEIELLNKLYNDVKSDMQDLGVWPVKEGTPQTQIMVQGGSAMAAAQLKMENEKDAPLADALPNIDGEVLKRAGRTLVMMKRENSESHDSE